MEHDYITFTPVGMTTEILITFTCKMRGKTKKVRMNVPHFLLIYKKANKQEIKIEKGKGYTHLERD
jgi:hypothetical protein